MSIKENKDSVTPKKEKTWLSESQGDRLLKKLLEFWPPELRGNKLLLFKPTHFVVLATATLGNKHSDQGLGSCGM